MNIVDLISSQLSGDVIGKLSGLVGGTEQQTSAVTKAAVPALLGVFGKMASSRSGADQLANAMGGLDTSMLGNLVGLLGGSQASSVSNIGGNILSSLLGGGNLTKLVGSLASFVGSQPDLIRKLLPYLAPIVLGMVAKQFTGRPDASGVSRLFSEQAGNIASSLPRGLSLADFGTTSGESESRSQGHSHQRNDTSVSRSRGHEHSHQTSGSGFPGWLLPLLALAGLGLAGYLWSQNRGKQEEKVVVARERVKEGPLTLDRTEVVEERGNRIVDTVQDVLSIDPRYAEAVRVGRNATELFGGLTSVLSGVTSADAARAAIPELEKLAPMLGSLETEAASLPAEEKSAFASFIGQNLGLLQKVIGTAMAVPGVKDLLGPVVSPMVETLTALSK
jgi:hypothetical protein